MSPFQVHQLSPQFTIEVLPCARGFTLSDHEKILIENIWNHEVDRRPSHLYNGQILNVVSFGSDKMVAEFVDYKYFLAQLRDPNFEPVLGLRTMAVSGITTVIDKVLMGKRSDTVTNFPKCYELVPSGGIDPGSVVDNKIDLIKQFELELWEETGISVTEIKQIRPRALVYDDNLKMYDLCAEIVVNYSVLKEPLDPSEEYEDMEWIAKSDIARQVRRHKEQFVPLSLLLIDMMKFTS
jgi:hypothetical protein